MYGVRFEESANGVGAYLPDVTGVAVVGNDKMHALELLDKALQWHIEGLLEDGIQLPVATRDLGEYEWHLIPQRLFLAQVTAGADFISISDGVTGLGNAWQSHHLFQLHEESSQATLISPELQAVS